MRACLKLNAAYLLSASLLMSGCGEACPPAGLETAAAYGNVYMEPLAKPQYPLLADDQWVRNPEVEAFLSDVLHGPGITALKAKYGMQCVPRTEPAACKDCFVCSRSFPGKTLPGPFVACHDHGQISVRAEIGPGDAVTAMTYRHWPPLKAPAR